MSIDSPRFVAMQDSGELRERARRAIGRLQSCDLCPWHCGVDRSRDETKVCGTGRNARVSSFFPHHGEESCLSGRRGSGTIFFARCNLHCIFCQNYDISHLGEGTDVGPETLAAMMLRLQRIGCHNINLVTPSHVVPQILEGLEIAVAEGLRLPLVYNSGGFDAIETLRLLDGVIDVYMPDFKFWSVETAARYLDRDDYPEIARMALKEMHRQVGDLELDEDGLAVRGLLVRHLVMPGRIEETRAILRYLQEEISPQTYVNLLEQYRPAGLVGPQRYVEINRPLTRGEYDAAAAFARSLGLRLDT